MADVSSLEKVYHYHHHRHVCCAYLTPFYLAKVQSGGTSWFVFFICWLLLYPKGFPTSLVALLLSDGSLRVICRIPGLSGPEPDYESQVNARANQATLGEPLR